MTTSNERLVISDEGNDQKYHTTIPNIIFSLGLSPYELSLYCYLKKVAGEGGVCYQYNKTICKATGMERTKLKECKKSLANPREELGGLPLIELEEKNDEDGRSLATHITIVDIWPVNMQLCSGSGCHKKQRDRYKNLKTSNDKKSDGNPVETRGSRHATGGGRQTTGGGSPHGHVEEESFKNRLIDRGRALKKYFKQPKNHPPKPENEAQDQSFDPLHEPPQKRELPPDKKELLQKLELNLPLELKEAIPLETFEALLEDPTVTREEFVRIWRLFQRDYEIDNRRKNPLIFSYEGLLRHKFKMGRLAA